MNSSLSRLVAVGATGTCLVSSCGGKVAFTEGRIDDAGQQRDAGQQEGSAGANGEPYTAYCPSFPKTYSAALVTAAHASEALARVRCDRLVNCCLVRREDHGACVAAATDERFQARVNGGKMRIEVEALRAFLTARSNEVTCQPFMFGLNQCAGGGLTGMPTCDGLEYFAKPSTPIGSTCENIWECPDSTCDEFSHLCLRYEVGQACGGDIDAGDIGGGEVCSDFGSASCNPATSYCDGMTCVPFPSDGSCHHWRCPTGDLCDATSNRCLAGLPEGSSCVPEWRFADCSERGTCASGLRCTGVCVPETELAEQGGSCAFDRDCALGLYCKGEAYDASVFHAYVSPGTCAPRKSAGATCGNHGECVEGTHCNGTCHADGDVGDACSPDDSAAPVFCRPGLICTSGLRCARAAGLHGTCAQDSDCMQLLTCVGGSCEAQ